MIASAKNLFNGQLSAKERKGEKLWNINGIQLMDIRKVDSNTLRSTLAKTTQDLESLE
jgi:hypothetical protein